MILFSLSFTAGASAKGGASGRQTAPALPVLVLGANSGTPAVPWEDLQAGKAGFSLLNNSADGKAIKVSVGGTQLSLPRQDIPLTLEPQGSVTLQPWKTQRFNLSVPAGSLFDLPRGSYNAVVTIRSTNFAALNVSVQVTIPAVQPRVGKATLLATRTIPFTHCWRGSLIVPLQFPPSSSGLLDVGPKDGIVHRDLGGLATVKWIELKSDHGTTCCANLTVESLPSAGRYEGEVNFGAVQDKNSTLALSVIGTDHVVWPILVTALGIILGWIVNRYVGVLRVVWDLYRQEAALGQAFQETQSKFERLMGDAPAAGYAIGDDVQHQRAELRGQFSRLTAKWVLSLENDSDYKNALAALQSLKDGVTSWGQFGPALISLQNSLSATQSEEDPEKVLPKRDEEPKLFVDVRQLLQGTPISVEELLAKLQETTDKKAALDVWRSENREAQSASSSLEAIPRRTLTPDQAQLFEQAQEHLVSAWQHLWVETDVQSLKTIGAPGGDLDNAQIAIAQITVDIQPGARLRPELALREEAAVPESGAVEPANDTDREALYHLRISFGDFAATVFAFVIALCTGLSLKYFGQAFGTIQDYLGLFLWAAGTKAALDIITSVVGRFSKSRLL